MLKLNSIKNRIFITLAIISITMFVGCNQEISNDDISPMDSSLLGMSIDTSSSYIEETTTVTTITENTTSTEVINTTEPTVLGYNLDELTSIAEELYSNACEKYQNILIDCYYGVDFSNYIVDENGRKYFLIINDAYNNIDTVLEDWHTIFNDNFNDLVNSTYLEYDGSLYGYTAILQKNTNYKNTNIQYYSSNDNEITFKATGNYSSGEKIFNFSIEYSPSTHEWHVSKFTMPY